MAIRGAKLTFATVVPIYDKKGPPLLTIGIKQ